MFVNKQKIQYGTVFDNDRSQTDVKDVVGQSDFRDIKYITKIDVVR